MKLFKMDLVRGRKALEAVAHGETADAAKDLVRSRYTGWELQNVVEILREAHFIIAELGPG
jgi:hypothetical protein